MDDTVIDDDLPFAIIDPQRGQHDTQNWNVMLCFFSKCDHQGRQDGIRITEVLAITENLDPCWDQPPFLPEFVKAHAKDPYCKQVAATIGLPAFDIKVENHGLIVRKSNIDGALEKVDPKKLQARLLYLAHYPPLSGCPGQRHMYDAMRLEYYWTHMANDVHPTVDDYRKCAKAGSHYKHKRHLTIFPPSGPLEFITIDILGPLPRMKKGNQYVVVIIDCYSELTRAIHTPKTSDTNVSTIIFDN